MENHKRFSNYQISLLNKAFIFFLFNMLIVPGFAAAAFSNLYELITEGMQKGSSLFKQLFEVESGDFFLILVLQQAGFSFLTKYSSLSELVWTYFSPSYYIEQRRLELVQASWTKSHESIHQYGMNYSTIIVLIGIGMVFRWPALTPAGRSSCFRWPWRFASRACSSVTRTSCSPGTNSNSKARAGS